MGKEAARGGGLRFNVVCDCLSKVHCLVSTCTCSGVTFELKMSISGLINIFGKNK